MRPRLTLSVLYIPHCETAGFTITSGQLKSTAALRRIEVEQQEDSDRSGSWAETNITENIAENNKIFVAVVWIFVCFMHFLFEGIIHPQCSLQIR